MKNDLCSFTDGPIPLYYSVKLDMTSRKVGADDADEQNNRDTRRRRCIAHTADESALSVLFMMSGFIIECTLLALRGFHDILSIC